MAFLFLRMSDWVSKTLPYGMFKVEQQQAFWTVAYSADPTWTSELCSFQKANMNLYLAALRYNRGQDAKWAHLLPRTVRDRIPNSRLARYGNYEYNDARELSYTPMVMRYQRLYHTFNNNDAGEPWMLEEIDDLLTGFLSCCGSEDGTVEDSSSFVQSSEAAFESPFLNASNFNEMILKLRTGIPLPTLLNVRSSTSSIVLQPVSSSIKEIWDSQCCSHFSLHSNSKRHNLFIRKSAADQMFVSLEAAPSERKVQNSIKILTTRLKEQNKQIFKKQAEAQSWLKPVREGVEHRRLYSAVLQGPSSSHLPPNYSTCKKEASTESLPEPQLDNFPPLIPCRHRCPYSPTGSIRGLLPPPVSTAYCSPTSIIFPRVLSTALVPNTSFMNFRQTPYYPLLLQNASVSYSNQRFPVYRTVTLPPRHQLVVPFGGWIVQSPDKSNIHPPGSQQHYHVPAMFPRHKEDAQELKSFATEPVLDEHDFVPVTSISSEELELQALEQYNTVHTNVFQELERQAMEQYEQSENQKSPSKRLEKAPFGGWLVGCLGGVLKLDSAIKLAAVMR